VAGYRASAGIDRVPDQADLDVGNQLRMPVTVIQQDWGSALGFDASALRKAWAPDLEHFSTQAGDFMAEETPEDIAQPLRDLLLR
jgi:hypothetical protein